jgi:hypothetical protein
MKTFDFEEINKKTAEDEFWAIRGKAIQAYAQLEQSLRNLFCLLSGTVVSLRVV